MSFIPGLSERNSIRSCVLSCLRQGGILPLVLSVGVVASCSTQAEEPQRWKTVDHHFDASTSAGRSATSLGEGEATAKSIGPVAAYPWRMDFAMPDYGGMVEISSTYEETGRLPRMDLQLLHSGLLVLGNDYTLETLDRVYAENKKELDRLLAQKINPWIKFRRFSATLFDEFLKTYTIYKDLDRPQFFRIHSEDDVRYQQPQEPLEVTRFSTSRGNYRGHHHGVDKLATLGNLLANYSYLRLPFPLASGCVYRIEQGDGRWVQFLYDENLTVSRAIKVNQGGYAPHARRKFAYLGAWQPGQGAVSFKDWEQKRFEVCHADSKEVALTGTIRLLAENPKTFIGKRESLEAGEIIYELDISELNAEGEFYIRIPGIGRSWPFMHSQKGVGRSFFVHLRGLFHQRAGQAIREEYSGWPRAAAHQAAFYADYVTHKPYNKPPIGTFDAIKNVIAKEDVQEVLPKGVGGIGGWYDAADYDRRWFHYDAIWDLLLAYEIAPRNFSDGQEHTYESANGIPDLLDEAAWGLILWKNTQRPDGGVSERCEQTAHPDTKKMRPNGRPQNDKARMYLSSPTREGSLRYAAAAAHLGRLLQSFDAEEADSWLSSAELAYRFGADSENHYERQDYAYSGKPFREAQELIDISKCHAALELYMVTKESAYLTTAVRLFREMKPHLKWPIRFVREDYWWAFYQDEAIPEEIRLTVRREYLQRANKYASFTERNSYRSSIDPKDPWDTSWGKASGAYLARHILMGFGLTGDPEYFDAASLCADWLQGCNPLGMSWTSGIGYNYPWCFLQGESEEDGITDPVPGVTVYGVTGNLPLGAKLRGYNLADYQHKSKRFRIHKRLLPDYVASRGEDGSPVLPYWRRWVGDFHDFPPMQEYTVFETISPCILLYGVLMGEGWQPGEALRNMRPREEQFIFGLWPTP